MSRLRRGQYDLEIDVSSVLTRDELHALLAQAFRFPDYYGRNWDAFDECIREVRLPGHVRIVGLHSLRERLPREAELLMACLRSFIEEHGSPAVQWDLLA